VQNNTIGQKNALQAPQQLGTTLRIDFCMEGWKELPDRNDSSDER